MQPRDGEPRNVVPLRLGDPPPVPEPTLYDVLAKLRYGADGEFSASLKPAECAILLAWIGDPPPSILTMTAKSQFPRPTMEQRRGPW